MKRTTPYNIGNIFWFMFQMHNWYNPSWIKFVLKKLSKVGGTYAKDRYVYHWWPLSSRKKFKELS
jgi:hypothetical protein